MIRRTDGQGRPFPERPANEQYPSNEGKISGGHNIESELKRKIKGLKIAGSLRTLSAGAVLCYVNMPNQPLCSDKISLGNIIM